MARLCLTKRQPHLIMISVASAKQKRIYCAIAEILFQLTILSAETPLFNACLYSFRYAYDYVLLYDWWAPSLPPPPSPCSHYLHRLSVSNN